MNGKKCKSCSNIESDPTSKFSGHCGQALLGENLEAGQRRTAEKSARPPKPLTFQQLVVGCLVLAALAIAMIMVIGYAYDTISTAVRVSDMPSLGERHTLDIENKQAMEDITHETAQEQEATLFPTPTQELTTSPTPNPEPASALEPTNIIDTMTAEQYRGLIRFFDAFARHVAILPYLTTERAIINFAVLLHDNGWSDTHVTPQMVEETAWRFFGITGINHDAVVRLDGSNVYFRNGFYTSWGGVGGVVFYWYNVSELYDNNDGTFTAVVQQYAFLGGTDSSGANIRPPENRYDRVGDWVLYPGQQIVDGIISWDSINIYRGSSDTVVIRPFKYNGEDTWQIININGWDIPERLFYEPILDAAVQPTPPHIVPPATGLVGRWESEDGWITLEFSPDGRGLMDGTGFGGAMQFAWETSNGRMRIHMMGTISSGPYSVRGDVLTMELVDEHLSSLTQITPVVETFRRVR